MKLLLTSGGITNPSIHRALERLLGKPVGECDALLVPTAQWGHPLCGPQSARGFVAGIPPWGGLATAGWRRLGMLELTALPSLETERWRVWVDAADVLLVDGGEATYLTHHLRASGLANLLPDLDAVWVGVSAGSMALTPRIGSRFVEWPSAPDDRTLGLVDFSIFPHLDGFATNTLEHARAWADEVGGPCYSLDDQSAIVIDRGGMQVVSEGTWHRLR